MKRVHSRWPPRVGDIVHYVAHGTPVQSDGTQAYPSVCRAAIVTALTYDGPFAYSRFEISLCVLNPTGVFFNVSVPGHPGDPADLDTALGARCTTGDRHYPGGTWHIPEADLGDEG